MTSLFKNIRYAIRGLIRRPTFAAVGIITLALSIGANTAMFSVVNAVLLRALPYENPQRLVSIGKKATPEALPGLAAYEYLAWKDRSAAFDGLAAYGNDNFNLTGQGEPERIACGQVTASLFSTLGVQPVAGRWFSPDEDRPGQNQVAIVSEGFWARRFGRDPALFGKTLTLDNKPYRVVGVMPGNFRFPGGYDIWVPLVLDPVKETQGDFFTLVEVVGRLKQNATSEQAQQELSLISKQATEQVKDPPPTSSLEVLPLHQQLIAGVRTTVLVLWGAVGLVMLLACVNLANLMLSRTVGRQREMAVRAAVGASRLHLIYQLLTEAVVLGLAGGILGILLADLSSSAIASLVPKDFAGNVYDLQAIKLDWRVFSFSLGLSVITSIIFGLAPALSASRVDLVKGLRETGGSGLMRFGFRSLRGWLVVSELALALILLLAAGLLARSFNHLMTIDPGFDRTNVLTAHISLPSSNYTTPVQTTSFYTDLLGRVKSMQGVRSVGIINHTPLSGFTIVAFTGIEGQPEPDTKREKPLGVGVVSADYFRTLGIPLLSGRSYDQHDNADSNKVALVNQAFVKRYYPSVDPLGKRIGFGCKNDLCRTIVGVVGNIKQDKLTEDPEPEVYVPFSQMPFNGMTILVRTKGDPLSFAKSLRSEVSAIDKNQPLSDVKTLEQRVAEATAVSRALMFLFSGFALLALVLATVGVYGIVSYSVSQRTREIGIRVALGAQAADVRALVLKNGIALACAGVAFGLAGAFALTRFLTTLLFGVTPTDRLTFVLVPLAMIAVALIAIMVPARRATKVDPLVALRHE